MLRKTHRIFLSLFFIFNVAVTGYLYSVFHKSYELLKLSNSDLVKIFSDDFDKMILTFDLHLAVFVFILWALFMVVIYYARNNPNVTEY